MSENEDDSNGSLNGFGTPENGKSEYVKLNVGGALFQTTLTTLLKHDTMLRAMFSGRMEPLKDDEGWIKIDRSGKHFGTILNFLRDGSVPLPECRSETLEILAEAKYYLIQDLILLCNNWLNILHRDDDGSLGNCVVLVLSTRKDCDSAIASSSKPVIKLLMNRHNNKFSYTSQSEDNMLKNLELFERLLLRFASRVLFIKDVGVENAEICQWSFFGQGTKQAEICCTSIVYATDKKHTKVEFPEARILEEAMNILLFEERNICSRCGREKRHYSPNGITAQLQLPPVTYSSHSASVSPQLTPSPLSSEANLHSAAATFDERRRPGKV
uniref:BTB domain-containing protein n=1 Tax=Syphacia muris TaxID=451379 RepID=A0A0N5AH72_9BILA